MVSDPVPPFLLPRVSFSLTAGIAWQYNIKTHEERIDMYYCANYGLAVALCVVTMLCWGSWGVGG